MNIPCLLLSILIPQTHDPQFKWVFCQILPSFTINSLSFKKINCYTLHTLLKTNTVHQRYVLPFHITKKFKIHFIQQEIPQLQSLNLLLYPTSVPDLFLAYFKVGSPLTCTKDSIPSCFFKIIHC